MAHGEVDIVVHTKDSDKIAESVKKTGLFNHVVCIKSKRNVKRRKTIFHALLFSFKRGVEIVNNIFIVNKIARHKNYQSLLISNLSVFTILLYNKLKKQHPNLEFCLFEEGVNIYSQSYTEADKPDSLHRKYVNKSGIIANLDKLYLFLPELLEWKAPKAQIIALPKMNVKDPVFVQTINDIFGLYNIPDKYDKPVIFFEESHFTDGFEAPDVEIVNQIAQITGKENIMIKLHPRSVVNRFAKLGYATNTDTNIPWEAIVLNQDFTNKILIAIASGSVLYPYLYFGIPLKSFSLLNTLPKRPGMMDSSLGDMMNKIYQTYPSVFYAPADMNHFLATLAQITQAP
jgi:hypothetical protein